MAYPLPHDAPLFILVNQGSGADDPGETQAAIQAVLTEAGRQHQLIVIEDPERLTALAEHWVGHARARDGAIVVAGGDGTIRTVAQATLGTGCPFGVLPQGTFNYFSRAQGIPTETTAATRLLLDAHVRPVQVGLINDRLFLVNASLGLYPQLLEEREGYKRQFGRNRMVAFGSGMVTLLRDHDQWTVEIERHGEATTHRTKTLFVANNRLQIERIGIPEADALDQGRLVAILVSPVGSFRMLWLMLRGALGQLGAARPVITFELEHMKVDLASPRRRHRVKVATDGEITWVDTPIEFRVAPHPLNLLTPPPR